MARPENEDQQKAIDETRERRKSIGQARQQKSQQKSEPKTSDKSQSKSEGE